MGWGGECERMECNIYRAWFSQWAARGRRGAGRRKLSSSRLLSGMTSSAPNENNGARRACVSSFRSRAFFLGSFVFEGRHAILSFFFLCVCVIVHDCLLAMMSLEVLFSKRC